ncbi:inner membrane protein YbiR [Clostridium homopropionicum DSM 5847]|uniref:Inner membrane protein YbiR n=1 Tax=Clostridium homopropionicum DSM 5847 TaxID=1121318 RepID=A0A0L6Z6C2_9CLOT|nr:SLC13 family permease [Clostridium homopropionicum]KOA18519.1 inner membrane protein YbiR [Clostridium homopropionicum DSM 5847]SFF65485.1 transporter, YbiR family [Clostridium homopropionicum]
MKRIVEILKEEMVFAIALILAFLTSIISLPKVEYIDFKVLFSLFNLMVVVKAFEKLKILELTAGKILCKYKSARKVSLILIGLTFFSSMLITNDVALITFVPITLIIGIRAKFNVADTIIFQTLAANIGSSLTPMGNPQNLFLFSFYNLKAVEFFKVTGPLVAMGGICLIFFNLKIKDLMLQFSLKSIKIKNMKKAIIYGILFIIIILSVFNVIDYRIVTIITIVIVLILDKRILKQIDYLLLMTFVFFFIFIGNVSNMDFINSHLVNFLNSKTKTYIAALTLSQGISNVPCSIFMANFTNNWREVLLGVNIGGMGTLIASLASLISYKLYVKSKLEHRDNNQYLVKFTLYNFSTLFIMAIINYFIYIY